MVSAVMNARCRSDEKMHAVVKLPAARCAPSRLACRTPWLVRGESVIPALDDD